MIKRTLLLLCVVVLLAGAGVGGWFWWQQRSAPVFPRETGREIPFPQPASRNSGQPDMESVDPEINFTPDPGLRIENASLPAPSVDAYGTVYLYYNDNSAQKRGNLVATSSDGFTFSPEAKPTEWRHDPRVLLLPGPDESGNPIYRRYLFEPDGALRSESSGDGKRFVRDSGERYRAQPNDKGRVGVWDHFVDSRGGIVLLYIGDMAGLNNIRRAYSPPGDNGWTFMFDRGDMLGDASAGGGPNSYVDQKSTVLPNGQVRLFVMKQGIIYSFISNDDGKTFSLEPGVRLSPEDFREFKLYSLHDPWVVQLPDGRYRMYVAAALNLERGPNQKFAIVSATTSGE